MPWSDWQTADLLPVYPSNLGLEWHFDHGTYDENVASDNMGTPSLYCLRQWGTVDGYSGDVGTTRARQWTAPPDWATQRDWHPALLNTLTLRTDYDVRPDRTGTEKDAYIEYDAGDNQHVSWDTGSAFLPPGGLDLAGTNALTFDLGMTAGTGYAAPTAPPAIPSIGSVFASGSQATPIGTHFPGPPDPTPAKSFTISIEIPTGSIAQPDPTVMPGPTVQLTYIDPTMYVQPPRWRYWVPDTTPLPLRQRQRDDGLGLSGTPRWRGGNSRQSSNRWRAYL